MKKIIYILMVVVIVLGAWQIREHQKDKWLKEDKAYRECLIAYNAYTDPKICLLLRDASLKQIKELESLGLL